MPATTLLLFPLTLLLLLLLSPEHGFATHVTCGWRPGTGNPEGYYYRRFCTAGVNKNKDGTADYTCSPGQSWKPGVKVADWGRRGKGVLEWLSPCAPGGYGKKEDGGCFGNTWVICLGDNFDHCLGMANQDDCQWPNAIDGAGLPSDVKVYYHLDDVVKAE